MKSSWKPRVLGLALPTLLSLLTTTWVKAQDNCLACHRGLKEEKLSQPAVAMDEDVHAAAGIRCADCHGGDATVTIEDGDYGPAKAKGTGYRGKLGPADIPELCGGCHSDPAFMHAYDPDLAVNQLTQYWTSHHGEEIRAGDDDVAQCASCHGAHGILAVKDPRAPVYPTNVADTCGRCHADETLTEEHGLPADTVATYRASVHGKALYEAGDLGSPTCNTCHGDHGATPPDVATVQEVCGNCHAVQQEMFEKSPHRKGFEDTGDPACETCHDYHEIAPATDARLGVDEDQICGDCHTDEEEDAKQILVAKTLRGDLEDLEAAIAEATAPVHEAAVMGMEVSDAELALLDANQALMQARIAVHAVSVDVLSEHTDKGRVSASEAQKMGLAALDELQFRRKGLAVAVFFIMLTVIGLFSKIRQIEGRS